MHFEEIILEKPTQARKAHDASAVRVWQAGGYHRVGNQALRRMSEAD